MGITSRKLSIYADNIKSLSNTPTITGEALKIMLDGRTDKEIKTNFNALIDDLVSAADGASGSEQIGSAHIAELKDPDNASLQALTVWKQIKAATLLILASPSKTETLTGKTLVEPVISGGLYLNAEKDAGLIESATAEVVLYGTNGNKEVALTMKPFYTGEDYSNVLMIEGRDVAPAKVWNELNDGPTSGLSAQYAAEASKLTTARKINGVSYDGSSAIQFTGVCSTSQIAAVKELTITGYTETDGAIIGVRFAYGNTCNTDNISLKINGGTARQITVGGSTILPLTLRSDQVYLFYYKATLSKYTLLGFDTQGSLVSLRDSGGFFTSEQAEGVLQEVGSHLVALDGSAAARYTKTEMQTSGSSLMHWDNLTNVPNLADDHWKTPVNTPADLPLVGNRINDLRLVGDDGDGKGAGYQCIATTGTLPEQWKKSFDVDWMSEEQTRITQENARVTAEGGRVTAETNRVSAENTRDAAELVRKNSETSRISGESSRQTGEQTRFNNEETRKSNETARQSAESIRAFLVTYDLGSAYASGMKVVHEGSTYQALKNVPTNTAPPNSEYWICIAQKGDNTTAATVSIADAEGHFTAENVEGALAETASALEETSNLVSTNRISELKSISTLDTTPTDYLAHLFTVTGYAQNQAMPNNADGKALWSIKGLTAENLVVNGDFSNGTTGWESTYGSTIAVSNNTLSVTGTGQNTDAFGFKYTTTPVSIGGRIYACANVQVTNSSCTKLVLAIDGSTAGTAQTVKSQTNPVSGTLYKLSGIITQQADFVGNVWLKISHTYPDATTANGKVMEVMGGANGVRAYDLDAIFGSTIAATLTADACDKIFENYTDTTRSTLAGMRLFGRRKNLFDKRKATEKYYVRVSDGALVSSDLFFASGYTKVNANTQYSQSHITGSSVAGVAYFDKNKVFISGLSLDGIATYTTPTNCVFIRTTGRYSVGATLDNFQIELGSTATPYEPYISSTTYTPQNLLRSVPSASDEVYLGEDGKVRKVQRVSDATYDGDEAWALHSYDSGRDMTIFKCPISNAKDSYSGSNIGGITVTTTLLITTGGDVTKVNSCFISSNYYWVTLTGNITLNTFKTTTLPNNNILLTYELATPITTELETIGNLTAYPNGSILAEPCYSGYATGASTVIGTASLPIKAINKVEAISLDANGNAVRTDVTASCSVTTTILTITVYDETKVYFYDLDIDTKYTTSGLKTYQVECPTGIVTHDFAAGATAWTLTANENKANYLKGINAGGAANVILQPIDGKIRVYQNASGQTQTLKTASSTGIAVENGFTVTFVYKDSDFAVVSKSGDSGWITPTLSNGWLSYGTGYTPRYKKDAFGRIHFAGALKSGTSATICFTLPVGYRPNSPRAWAVNVGGNGIGQVVISATGDVTLYASSTAQIFIDGVSFFID